MNSLEYEVVAICGYRNKGRKLYKELLDSGKKVAYIIERNYEALSALEKDLDCRIVGFNENETFYAQADAIIFLGDLPNGVVAECLSLAEIKLPLIEYSSGIFYIYSAKSN